MAHSVPPLPYDYNALEPHIDEQTMRIHHDKHHAAYVNNLNAALEKHPELQNKSAEDLIKDINAIPEAIRGAVRNNGGGHVNHTMFWEIMGPGKGGEPTGKIGASGPWFDTAAFAQPTGVRFGNTGRNQFYGPGGYTLDFSIFRSFPMGRERRLEFRLEGGNVLNHAIFANPQGSFTSATFGQITGINGNYPERNLRLGLRFQF